MRPLIRLACGLAAGMLLLLAGASVAFAADPLVTVDGWGGKSNDVTAGANAGTSRGTVRLGAQAPNSTSDGADGNATVTLGAAAPNSIGDPSSSVGVLSSGFAGLMANGDSAAEDATGVAPGAPSTDGAMFGLSQAFGSALSSFGLAGALGAPDGSGGSGGSGSGNAAAGESGAGTLPETSTGAFASGSGTDLPVLALFLGLLAGGLVARRRPVRSPS